MTKFTGVTSTGSYSTVTGTNFTITNPSAYNFCQNNVPFITLLKFGYCADYATPANGASFIWKLNCHAIMYRDQLYRPSNGNVQNESLPNNIRSIEYIQRTPDTPPIFQVTYSTVAAGTTNPIIFSAGGTLYYTNLGVDGSGKSLYPGAINYTTNLTPPSWFQNQAFTTSLVLTNGDAQVNYNTGDGLIFSNPGYNSVTGSGAAGSGI